MLGITEKQLQNWERHQLLPPTENFNMVDIVMVKTLRDLRRDRVPISAIQVAIDAARKHLQGVGDPLREVKLFRDGRRIRFEIAGQRIEAQSGQIVLDFNAASLKRLISFPTAPSQAGQRAQKESAESWFQKGLELEHNAAPMDEAIEAYENAVRLDPQSAGAWLNLGTIFFNARQWSQAERYYKRALTADPTYALAFFNIANLYDERGDWEKAMKNYCEALRLNPQYADAHYNLALLYQNRGRTLEALRHWRTYLKIDGNSQWAEIARRELEKLKKSTVVEGRRALRAVGDAE